MSRRCGHVGVAASQEFRCDLHPPFGEVCIGGMPTSAVKRSARTERDAPASCASSSMVQSCAGLRASATSLADDRIAQTGQPTRLFRRQGLDISAHHIDEHQFAQLGQHGFAAGALVCRFRDRKADEIADPARTVVASISRLDHRRQRFQQGIERPGVAGEIAADQLGRTRPGTVVDAERLWPAAAMSSTSGVGGSARMPGLLDMTCGSPLVKTMTSPASSAIACPPSSVRETMARGHHVIGDQVIGAGQNFRQDQLAWRRRDRPRSWATISKKAAPVSRTVFSRSDRTSAAIVSPPDVGVRTSVGMPAPHWPPIRTRCQAMRTPDHSVCSGKM